MSDAQPDPARIARVLATLVRGIDSPGCTGYAFDCRREVSRKDAHELLVELGVDTTPGCGHPACRWTKVCTIDERARAAELRNVGRLWFTVDEVLERELAA